MRKKQKENSLNIPTELNLSYLFTEGMNIYTYFPKEKTHLFFSDEVALYGGKVVGERPWERPAKEIPQLIQSWKKIELQIDKKDRSKDKEQLNNLMLEGIMILFKLLFWSNEQPVNFQKWQKRLAHFSIKPVNLIERIEFILMRPFSYHAFRQLKGIVDEQHKHFAREEAIKKASN